MYSSWIGGSLRVTGHNLYSAKRHKTENTKSIDAYECSNGKLVLSRHRPITQICRRCVYNPAATMAIQWGSMKFVQRLTVSIPDNLSKPPYRRLREKLMLLCVRDSCYSLISHRDIRSKYGSVKSERDT